MQFCKGVIKKFHILAKLKQILMDVKNQRNANSTYTLGGVSCLADTFVQAESLVLRTNFSAKKPALRVAANH